MLLRRPVLRPKVVYFIVNSRELGVFGAGLAGSCFYIMFVI